MARSRQRSSRLPRDFRDPAAYKNGHSKAAIARTIQKGMPGTSMPGYGHLSEEEREQIAAYIRSLLRRKGKMKTRLNSILTFAFALLFFAAP